MTSRGRTLALLLLAVTLVTGCRTSSPQMKTTALRRAKTEFELAVLKTGCKRDSVVKNAIPYHKQDTTMWCWAASAQMVMSYFQTAVRQCEQVNEYCEEEKLACASVDCCQEPRKCMTGGWPLLERYDFAVQPVERYLKPVEVVQELACEHRPFLFSLKEVGGSGHMMVAIDFLTHNGKDYLLVHDPLLGDEGDTRRMSYSFYKKGNFLHWRDYYQIKRVR